MELEFPSESFLEDYIFNKIDNGFSPIDDEIYEYVFRQTNLGPYGISDIITVNRSLSDGKYFFDVQVIELKNAPLKCADIAQLSRYMIGLTRMIERYSKKLNFDFEVKGQLIGKKSNDDNFVFILDYIENIYIGYFTVNVDEGFKVTNIYHGWYKIDESCFDISKYIRGFLK